MEHPDIRYVVYPLHLDLVFVGYLLHQALCACPPICQGSWDMPRQSALAHLYLQMHGRPLVPTTHSGQPPFTEVGRLPGISDAGSRGGSGGRGAGRGWLTRGGGGEADGLGVEVFTDGGRSAAVGATFGATMFVVVWLKSLPVRRMRWRAACFTASDAPVVPITWSGRVSRN